MSDLGLSDGITSFTTPFEYPAVQPPLGAVIVMKEWSNVLNRSKSLIGLQFGTLLQFQPLIIAAPAQASSELSLCQNRHYHNDKDLYFHIPNEYNIQKIH